MNAVMLMKTLMFCDTCCVEDAADDDDVGKMLINNYEETFHICRTHELRDHLFGSSYFDTHNLSKAAELLPVTHPIVSLLHHL